MSSTNYQSALNSAHDADMWGTVEDANIAALNGQTFATLALVDLLKEKMTPPVYFPFASDDTITGYHIGKSAHDAYMDYVAGGGFVFSPGGYEAACKARDAATASYPHGDYQVYLFAVTVVQP